MDAGGQGLSGMLQAEPGSVPSTSMMGSSTARCVEREICFGSPNRVPHPEGRGLPLLLGPRSCTSRGRRRRIRAAGEELELLSQKGVCS